MNKTWITSAAALSLVAIVAVGCKPKVAEEPPKPKVELSPDEAAAARRTIVAWLECEECTEGELEAVRKLGATAVPTLGATLERGPSAASREKARMHLEESYRKISEYAKAHPAEKIEISQDEYVKLYMENYVANYAVRSAQALAVIGGPEARKYLEAARSRKELREDVRAALDESSKAVK